MNSYRNNLLEKLKEAPLTKDLPKDVLAEIILPHLKPISWAEHSLVMDVSETKKRFFLIASGRVSVEAQHPQNGRSVSLFLLGPGEGHNLVTLLDGQPHEVLAESLDEVEAVHAPLTLWRQWLNDYPPMRQAAMRCAARRLRELAEFNEDLALHDTTTRLAHLLLLHLENEPTVDGAPPRLQGLSHGDIARLIGSTRVVITRLIGRFRREGILHAGNGVLRIADLERLLQKAERRFHIHTPTNRPK